MKRPDDDESVMQAVLAWGTARAEALRLRAERSALACEYEEWGDPSVGDPGVAACWHGSGESITDWCETCQKRQPLHEQFLPAQVKMRTAFRTLDRVVRRRVTARPGQG